MSEEEPRLLRSGAVDSFGSPRTTEEKSNLEKVRELIRNAAKRDNIRLADPDKEFEAALVIEHRKETLLGILGRHGVLQMISESSSQTAIPYETKIHRGERGVYRVDLLTGNLLTKEEIEAFSPINRIGKWLATVSYMAALTSNYEAVVIGLRKWNNYHSIFSGRQLIGRNMSGAYDSVFILSDMEGELRIYGANNTFSGPYTDRNSVATGLKQAFFRPQSS